MDLRTVTASLDGGKQHTEAGYAARTLQTNPVNWNHKPLAAALEPRPKPVEKVLNKPGSCRPLHMAHASQPQPLQAHRYSRGTRTAAAGARHGHTRSEVRETAMPRRRLRRLRRATRPRRVSFGAVCPRAWH